MGTFNLHASLLPQYRGAAPINHVIMQGETETGVTTFLIDHQIDTGNILLQENIDIADDETAGSLHDRLMVLGAGVVVETAEKLVSGTITPKPQDGFIAEGEQLKPAPKIKKEDCRINWNAPAVEVYNFIRGLSPYPAAYTRLELPGSDPLTVKVFLSRIVQKRDAGSAPGTIDSDGNSYLHVSTGDGWLSVTMLQQAGKQRMEAGDFLRGFREDITKGRFC